MAEKKEINPDILEYCRENLSFSARLLMEKFGISQRQAEKYTKLRSTNQLFCNSTDKKKDLFEAMIQLSDALKIGLPNRSHIPIIRKIDTDKHLIVIGADWHLGHPYINYRGVQRVAQDIREHENISFLGVGDLFDNSTNAKAPTDAQNMVDKNSQIESVEYIFDIMTHQKIDILFEGNHELRSFITDHFLATKFLSIYTNSHYGYYHEPFAYEIQGKKYEFFAIHKAKGFSQYNPLHPALRCVTFQLAAIAKNADIIITAHTHNPGKGAWSVAGKMRYMLSCGCMVEFDHYAERVGFHSSESGIPGIMLFSDFEPELFFDYREAIRKYLR